MSGRNAFRHGLRWFGGRLNVSLIGVVVFAATFWFTDHETNRHPAAPRIDLAAAEARRAAHPPEAKIFILLLDSLRYETAMDPEIMPNLAALRAEGVWAQVMPGFNASSAAAIRTAFTGRENAAVLAFVSTFLKSDAGVESIFHQMTAEGFRVGAYSMGFFKQFGDGVAYERQLLYRSPPELEDEGVDVALEAMNRGEFDVVISHINYTDYAAHDNGIGVPAYRRAFHRADALIPRVRANLPAGATLVVMGDHGHDELGRHGFGTDYGSLGVYCGPVFRRGLNLGTISQPSHRYLLSKAAGLPMRMEGYAGKLLPEALNVHGNELASLLAEAKTATGPARWPWVVWIYLSLLLALWLNLVASGWSPLDFSGARMLSPWLALPPLALSGVAQLVAAGVAFALVLGITARGASRSRVALWLGVPAMTALLLRGWGQVLWAERPALHGMPGWVIPSVWIAVVAVGAAVATRGNRGMISAALVAAAGLLLFPTNYAYGQSSALTPLLWSWFIFYAVSAVREGALRRADGGLDGGLIARLLGAAAGVFLFMQMFWSATAQNYLFAGWTGLLPGMQVDDVVWLTLAAFAAKAVIFFPSYPGFRRTLLGAGLITLLTFIESRAFIPQFYPWLWLVGASALAWLLLLRAGRPSARMFGLTFGFLFYVYNIVPNIADFTETSCMLAAVVLGARMLRWFPQPENARIDAIVLGVLGLFIAGWAMCRWSVTHLEWSRAYRWAPAPLVERYAIYLVPWIALKSVIPWAIIASVLKFELKGRIAFPANELLLVMAVKIAATLMINTGLGGNDTLNRGYLEGAQVSGLMCLLFLGVVLMARAWPRPPGSVNAGAATS